MNLQSVRFAKIDYDLGLIPQMVSALTNTFVLILGVYLTMQGKFSAGMVMAFQGFMTAFMAPAQELIAAGQSLQEMRTQMERIEDVMEYPSDVQCRSEAGEDEVYDKLSGEIEMKNVTFGYSRLAPPLIKDFSLTLKRGSRVAFVGPFGCGKSTISNLISGLYQPWSGTYIPEKEEEKRAGLFTRLGFGLRRAQDGRNT